LIGGLTVEDHTNTPRKHYLDLVEMVERARIAYDRALLELRAAEGECKVYKGGIICCIKGTGEWTKPLTPLSERT
jgi:hypothetical protein